MEVFEIYTIGSGYYLEKVFNAIRLILHPNNNFISVMKLASLAAIIILTIRAGINNDFKSAAKWFFGVTILVGLFLSAKADVLIFDTLPDSYGRLSAPRKVDSVPWGLALIGSVTSNIGNSIAQKFDESLAGVFNNSDYQKTGILFGSKIVEDTSKMRIDDAGLKQLMGQFYKKCIVPDLNMGYRRTNGYTLKDLTESADILEFLKDHSSRTRIIYTPSIGVSISNNTANKRGNPDHSGYMSCKKTAEYIKAKLDSKITLSMPILAKKFSAFFGISGSGSLNPDTSGTSEMFKSVLENSYGIFIRNQSKEAKDILLQNLAINSLNEAADAKLYGKVATESMTKLAYNSVGQMAQKFIPILRAVLECLFYGVFPLVLILMVMPIGLDILKNYAFGFIYLQLWQPMYAILFCIASSWGKLYASGISDITFSTHASIMHINEEISAISGYMLTLVPVLSLFITKGMIANMGNLASSIIYIPQTASVQNAESAVKGNYQIGTTSIDTHQSNSMSANKFDDNYTWMSGMKSFSMLSGAQERIFGDGRSAIDASGALSNLGGLAKIDISKAIGNRYDKAINDNISSSERHASNFVDSTSSAYSKLLGYDQSYSKGISSYEAWNNSLSSDQRRSFDEAKSYVEKFAKNNGISEQDALKIAVAANSQVKSKFFGLENSLNLGIEGSTSKMKSESLNKMLQAAKDDRFAKNLSEVENYAVSKAFQENNAINNNLLEGVRSDFNRAKHANFEMAKSLDKVHSLQESKANFESNSSSISQDLTNKFAEEKIQKYGAAGFEELVRNHPEKTNQELEQFLNSNVSKSGDYKSKDFSFEFNNEYNHEKSNITQMGKTIIEGHGDNLKSVLKGHESNNNLINNQSNKLKLDVKNQVQEGRSTKRAVARNIGNNNKKLEERSEILAGDNSHLANQINSDLKK